MRTRVAVGVVSSTLIVLAGAGATASSLQAEQSGSLGASGAGNAAQPADPLADPLAGPRVEVPRFPWRAEGFEVGMDGQRGGGVDPREMRWVGEIYEAMASDAADARVRMTPVQVEALQSALVQHAEAVQAYRAEHAEEMSALRRQVGFEGGQARPEPQRGARGRIQSDEPRPTAEEELMRQRFRELNRGGPSPEGAYGQVWAVLNESQREHVRTEMAQRAQENLAAAGTGMAEGRGNRGAGGQTIAGNAPGGQNGRSAAGGRGNRGGGAVDTTNLDARTQDILRKLRAMPEQERAALIQQIERLMTSGAPGGAGGNEPGQRRGRGGMNQGGENGEQAPRRGRRGMGGGGAGDNMREPGTGGGDRRRAAQQQRNDSNYAEPQDNADNADNTDNTDNG